jgi:hypothetical protein
MVPEEVQPIIDKHQANLARLQRQLALLENVPLTIPLALAIQRRIRATTAKLIICTSQPENT